MILLRIVSKSETKIEQIAEVLLRERFAIDVNIKLNTERAEIVNDELVTSKIYLLTAKTRAVLFDNIDNLLNEMYPNHLPEVYALPIMQMDWKQAESLTKDVQSVPKPSKLRRVLNKVKGAKRHS